MQTYAMLPHGIQDLCSYIQGHTHTHDLRGQQHHCQRHHCFSFFSTLLLVRDNTFNLDFGISKRENLVWLRYLAISVFESFIELPAYKSYVLKDRRVFSDRSQNKMVEQDPKERAE
jgi:hypothetical protein